ncbi:hypothetical protein DVP66_10135 [Yersinia enterocolitica]|nr:hypothetical protein [Yersinia enterocolitica]
MIQQNINYTSVVVAVIGWLVASYFNNRAFKRSEVSRQKDKISQQIENFFEKVIDKLSSRDIKENELDDFITASISIIELQVSHLSLRMGNYILCKEKIAILRSKPLDFLKNHNNYKHELHDLKFSILEEIEQNYTQWFFKGYCMRCYEYIITLGGIRSPRS